MPFIAIKGEWGGNPPIHDGVVEAVVVGEAEVEAEANAGIVQERRAGAGAGVILEEEEESMEVEEQQERGMDQVVSSRSLRNAQTVHKRC